MFSSVFALAVSGMLAGAETANLPVWQSDYRQARELATREHKPMAVVIGNGANGWDKVVVGGAFGSETVSTLRTGFVCVYVDNSTPAGAKLAKDFGVTETGVVFSDRTAGVQAFRRLGAMPDAELHQAAVKYSDPKVVVTSTDTGAPVRVEAYYPPQASGTCPNCRPAYYR